MLSKNTRQTTKEELDTTTFTAAPLASPTPAPAAPPNPSEGTSGELERLRDILYGSQTRNTEKRLTDLENKVESLRRELTSILNEKIGELSDTSSDQVAAVRKDLTDRLDRQGTDQSAQTRAAQKELADRLDQQNTEHAVQLRTVQKELADRVEKLVADLLSQVRSTQKELSDRLDKLSTENSERSRTIQTETRQRDDNLRQELLTLAALQKDMHASRYDVAQLLMQLAQRLLNEDDQAPR